jgi:hypothetical protein
MKRILYFFIGVLAVACAQNEKNTKPITVNINVSQNTNNIADLQSRITINRLIPIETTDISLVGVIQQIIIYKESIFILNSEGIGNNNILHYDKVGNFIRKIDRCGDGPQEYIRASCIFVENDKLYVADNMGKRIQQYTLDGTFLNTFPVDHNIYQMLVNQLGDMILTGSYLNEYMLYIYNNSGEKIASYFPKEERMTVVHLTRTTMRSLSFYKDDIIVTNYFDPTIYYIRDNDVKPLAELNFGSNNIPKDFLSDPQMMLTRFTEVRKNSIMGISDLTITDDWIIFSPDEGPELCVVYYDRKKNNYIINKGLDIPYSTFLGGLDAPYYYTDAGEYYAMIHSWELREMIENLSVKDKDYLSKYEFLNGIDPSKIHEEDNPWLVFYTLK